MAKKPMGHELEVDKQRLDVELESLPSLYWKWAERLAHAKNELAEAKNDVELVYAELCREARNDPAVFGLKKVTDSAVEVAVKGSDRYRRAVTGVNAAKHKVDLYEGMVNGVEIKKYVVHDLVVLHGQAYFADKRPGGVSRETVQDMENRSIRKPLKR